VTTEITYLKGDATYPVGEGQKIIFHAVNTVGAWGRGFVLAISKRWKEPEEFYLSQRGKWFLGDVQLVRVADDITVANMVAQRALRSQWNPVPFDPAACERCMEKVAEAALMTKASIHGPRLGSGLGGMRWGTVAHIIERTLCSKDIPVYIYDLEGK
jgi:hypothetical protein